MTKGRVLAVALGALLAGSSAHAASILFWSDFALGTDQMAAALGASGHVVTEATDEGNFITNVGLGGWDLVVYMNQNSDNLAAKAALETWVGGGGKAIYTDWFETASTATAFDAAYTGNENETSFSVSNPFLAAGLTNPLSLTNPGWGVFSMGMSALGGGATAATFTSGEAAIIIGNGGGTIINGFLDDTFITGADGFTLYTNEVNLALGAVPEPGTVALMAIGLVAIAALRRRQA